MVPHFASFHVLEFFPPKLTGNNDLSDWVIWRRGCQAMLNQAKAKITSGPLGSLVAEE
jgi:hypothetical protein